MTKLSRSALYYKENEEARQKKAKYDTKYHATPERKKYRAKLNRERRRRKLKGDSRDLSHKQDGSLVLESKSANRARNGAGDNGRLK